MENNYYDWSEAKMIEVVLKTPDDFLKVKETLSRIGVEGYSDNSLYQTCHILHKKGRYFIVHFKEMFGLDHKTVLLTEEDICRRNTIIMLLERWKLVKVIGEKLSRQNTMRVTVVPFKEKHKWNLVQKYKIGKENGKSRI